MIKKSFKELTINELYDILKLRSEIFILEQNCAYQDLDDVDKRAEHYFILNDKSEVISYARFIPENIKYETASIGRVVTKKEARKNGYSKRIIEEMIRDHKQQITISAQVQAQPFYEKIGFKTVGNIYLEDDIPHIKMTIN
ncbi:Acetyltransferase, GNAT family [Alteracholeplasma palmae J233]|uniref:Acetyltransferase, GNAT family n=1 Tax=Alteracholeplasma palmae (strain ATCC 49389 / J233) TaxID=1318466 RepID=U4KQG7_ALTPJ|nr:GNAT family N-acetyltransferase [Alteracholeplasma palmae]CCV64575.1 Acetyltransferase, GNAT family [Alteracholeplasma palmae J233]